MSSGGGLGASGALAGGNANNGREDDSNEFVSAVCWRAGTNCILGANSQGTIKILEMV